MERDCARTRKAEKEQKEALLRRLYVTEKYRENQYLWEKQYI